MKIRIERRPYPKHLRDKIHSLYVREWYVVEDTKHAPCLARFTTEDLAKRYARGIEAMGRIQQ